MEGFRKKFIVLIVVSVSIFLVSGLFLIYLIKDIDKIVLKANNDQQEIAYRAAILDRIQTLERESDMANLYTNALHQALPSENEVFSLDSTLKNLATTNNLNISFRFGTLTQAQDNEPKNYSFNLVLDGEINNILNWFDAFEKLPYSFRLSQIEINQNSPNNYNVKILGNIYLR